MEASRSKPESEITKLFVESASYILRATLVDKNKKKPVKSDPLWDASKLAVGDNFSCISYLKVEKIEGN